MAGDLDRFAVDGGLEQFLEYLKTKMGIRRPQEEGMAFKEYIYEIKRARGESMTSWFNRSDQALMDMRKKLATPPGANSSESTMIPPQLQGWLLLHRARLRNQDIFGVLTTTGGSLNIKLVEKSLLDLFTDDVFQSVDRSHGKDSGNPRKQHAFEAVEEIPEDDDAYLDEDLSENDDPTSMKTQNFLANEQIVSDIDDDLALDDEEYHEALLGYREARDLMKEARVARGFYPVAVRIRSDKPTGRGKSESSSVKNVSGKTGRGKGGKGSKGSGRPPDSRGRDRKGKGRGRSGARDGPSSSQVCFKCGSKDHWRAIVQRWMMALRIRRNETLELTHVVRGPAAILTILVMKSVPQTCFRWIPCVVLRFLLSTTTMSVKLMLHFWWNLRVSVFWTVVQPPRMVALRVLRPCSPRVMKL